MNFGHDSQINVLSKDILARDDKGLYYLAYFLFVLWTWLSRLAASPITSAVELVLQVTIVSLLVVSFFRQNATVTEWAISIVAVAIGFIVWRVSAEGWIFWLSLFIVCAKGARLKPLAICTLVSVSSVLIFAVVASSVGMIDSNISIRGSNGVVRNPMGFSHPNNFGACLLVVCVSVVPLLRGRSVIALAPFCLLAALVSHGVADSRTAALCLVLLALVLPIYHWMDRKAWARQLGLALLFILMAAIVISIGFMLYFDPARPLDAFLDKALSGRLRLAHTYYLDHAPELFGYDYSDGTVFHTNGTDYTFVVDNLFAHVLLRHGIIVFATLTLGLALLSLRMYKEGYFGAALLGIALFLGYGMSETLGCRVECNFFIISLWTVLYHRPISEFDDKGGKESPGAVSCSSADELSFREFAMLPIIMLRRRHG